MADLKGIPPLGGYDVRFGATRLVEVTDRALISMAARAEDQAALSKIVKKEWAADLPKPGRAALGDVKIVPTGADYFLVDLPEECVPGGDMSQVDKIIGDAAYLTFQTDGWCQLKLSGPDAAAALERLTMLDIAYMSQGSASRTLMEHLAVVLIVEKENEFLLLAASSSARSFLHAVETALRHVT